MQHRIHFVTEIEADLLEPWNTNLASISRSKGMEKALSVSGKMFGLTYGRASQLVHSEAESQNEQKEWGTFLTSKDEQFGSFLHAMRNATIVSFKVSPHHIRGLVYVDITLRRNRRHLGLIALTFNEDGQLVNESGEGW